MQPDHTRQQYDEAAAGYDWKVAIVEKVSGAGRLRRDLLQQARGAILDVACGTGRNFPFYPRGSAVTGVDLSTAMLEHARKRAAACGLDVRLIAQDAEHLDFPSRSFDTVVSSLAVCSYPHPVAVLREMSRVCKQDGRLLLLEHGRSDRSFLARLQDRFAERLARRSGCHIDREPLELAREAGMEILSHRRSCLGILHVIEGKPGA